MLLMIVVGIVRQQRAKHYTTGSRLEQVMGF